MFMHNSNNSIEEHVAIVKMPTPSRESCKQILKQRVNLAEQILGFVPGVTFQVEEKAYDAICDMSRNSPGLALTYLSLLLPEFKPGEYISKGQTIITETQVNNYEFHGHKMTPDLLCRIWNEYIKGNGMDLPVVKK
jgi:hypothetical protein